MLAADRKSGHLLGHCFAGEYGRIETTGGSSRARTGA